MINKTVFQSDKIVFSGVANNGNRFDENEMPNFYLLKWNFDNNRLDKIFEFDDDKSNA